MKDRKEKIVSGFLDSGFSHKGIDYKPITARTLLLLERCQSPYYFGGNQLRGLLDVLYIGSHDSKTVLAAMNDSWEETILEYAENFTTEDLTSLGSIVNIANENCSASVVEARDDGTKKKA